MGYELEGQSSFSWCRNCNFLCIPLSRTPVGLTVLISREYLKREPPGGWREVKADVAASSGADVQLFRALLSHCSAKGFLYLCVFHELTDIFHAYCETHRYSAVPCKLE
jgi:hypothetical protein